MLHPNKTHPQRFRVQVKALDVNEYYSFRTYGREQAERLAKGRDAELQVLLNLKAQTVFAPCGRLVGFRVTNNVRAGRTPWICCKVQLGKAKQPSFREFKYDGNFDQFWRKIKSTWSSCHNLTREDILSYREELKQAKRLYLQDVGAMEEANKICGMGTIIQGVFQPKAPKM